MLSFQSIAKGFMKIAVASSDGQRVDQHFGHAEHFYVYEIGDGMAMAEGPRAVQPYCKPSQAHSFEQNRLNPILTMLSDCRHLFVAKIGEAPRLALAVAGIQTTITNTYVHEILSNITGGSSCKSQPNTSSSATPSV